RDARCEPKPLQQPMPLWIGGSGERRTLRIVAEHADGWNTFAMAEDEYRHKLDVLERHCRDVDRDPGEIRRQLVFRAVLGEDEREAGESADELAARLRQDPEEVRRGCDVTTPESFAERRESIDVLGVVEFTH